MIIYEIRRILDNRPYTGYSTKFNSSEEFLASNYWGSGTYITPAIKKYGKEAFERKVLLKNIFDFKELKRYERLMIKKRKSHISQGGYNLTWGGDGILGYVHSVVSKQRISEYHADVSGENNPWFGKHLPEKLKQKISVALIGKHPTEATKQKLSVATRGENNPCFGRTGEKHPFFGIKRPEHSKKMRDEKNPRARSAILISPKGVEYKLSCYYSFCREHHLLPSCICEVLRGRQKNHRGWTGRYL